MRLDLIVFQLSMGREQICDFLDECKPESDDEGFEVSGFRNLGYYEFARLPNGEPILRARVVENQLWVEDKENEGVPFDQGVPSYIHERFKEELIPHTIYREDFFALEDFSSKTPRPIDISSSKPLCIYPEPSKKSED